MVTATSGPNPSRLKLVRNPVAGRLAPALYPTLPLNCRRLRPNSEVASAKAVPRSDCEEVPPSDPGSPADTFNMPYVSEKALSPTGLSLGSEGLSGRNRRIGRVEVEAFRVHFQSSLMSAPWPGAA